MSYRLPRKLKKKYKKELIRTLDNPLLRAEWDEYWERFIVTGEVMWNPRRPDKPMVFTAI